MSRVIKKVVETAVKQLPNPRVVNGYTPEGEKLTFYVYDKTKKQINKPV